MHLASSLRQATSTSKDRASDIERESECHLVPAKRVDFSPRPSCVFILALVRSVIDRAVVQRHSSSLYRALLLVRIQSRVSIWVRYSSCCQRSVPCPAQSRERRLTLPSRGCPKGCAFCAPLMSNVRPYVKTHQFVSIERSAKHIPSKAGRVLLVHCWSRPPKRSYQDQSQLAYATHRSQRKAGFHSTLALEAPAKENVSHSVGATAMRGSGFPPRLGLSLLRLGHANHR